ncbi:ankyrin repeat-containing protein [Anaeramoeba flamelloides]|uniref:Ankyrin repeat-containing protein n=1 Tax=Anaeramoeba flamelloides TaxID=1746091 RepID=A0AAV7ZIL9_9EUKA|nr:ankyrin repeat-containing protein [Anaeramoeba flamelloides]
MKSSSKRKLTVKDGQRNLNAEFQSKCLDGSDLEEIKKLYKQGANPKKFSPDSSKTCLHFVCESPKPTVDKLEFLISVGVRPNLRDLFSGVNCFGSLCSNKDLNLECMDYLINAGVDLKNRDLINGMTHLHVLAQNKSVQAEMLELLLTKCPELAQALDNKDLSAFYYLSRNDSITIELMDVFFKYEVLITEPTLFKPTVLQYLARNLHCSEEMIIHFLKKGQLFPFYEDSDGNNEFIDLLKSSKITKHIIDLIFPYFENRIDKKNLYGETGLLVLCSNQKEDISQLIKYFVQNFHPDVSVVAPSDQKNVLHRISENGFINDLELFQFFYEKGVNINHQNSLKRTPLWLYCNRENVRIEVVTWFLQSGAEPNTIDNFKLTCIHNYCKRESVNFEIIKLLFNKNLNLNQRDYKRFSISDYVCIYNKPVNHKILEFFLNKNPDYYQNLTNNHRRLMEDHTISYLLKNKEGVNIQSFSLMLNRQSHLLYNKANNDYLMKLIWDFQKIPIGLLDYLLKFAQENKLIQYFDINTQLSYLTKNEKFDVQLFKLLIDKRNNQNTIIDGSTILHKLVTVSNNDKFNGHLENISQIVEHLLRDGEDPTIPNSYNLTSIQIANNRILKCLLASYNNLSKDFERFYERNEFTDCNLKEFKLHKTLLELRIGKAFEEIKNITLKFSDEILLQIIKWVYGYKINYSKDLLIWFEVLEINNPEEKTLNADLKKLYQSNNKDFILIVQGEEIPVHRIILQARTEIYREMFRIYSETLNKISDYSHKTPQSMKVFVKYLYTDVITMQEIKFSNFRQLANLIDFYQITSPSKLEMFLRIWKQKKIN